MKASKAAVAWVATLVFCASAGALAQEFAPGVGPDGSIRVPTDDYRKEWSYLGTFSILGENSAAEFHVVYTQPTTVEAYRANGQFPDGAVLVKELYEAETGDLTTGRVSWSGKAAGWFIMIKDTEGRFPGNPLWGEGWGWALFESDEPDNPVTQDFEAECLSCHEPARNTDLVYVHGYPALSGKGR